jgi:hypothetical protein
LKVESTEGLIIRITELNAMSAMEEMDRKKVFGDAVVAGVKAPFQGAAKLVKEPVETTKGIIEGTGRFLSNIGRSIVSDDPHQDNALKVAIGYDAAKRAFAMSLASIPIQAMSRPHPCWAKSPRQPSPGGSHRRPPWPQ